MAANASVSKNWIVRMMITSLMFLGFGLWCLYDGMVTYPKNNEALKDFRELQQQGRTDEYPAMAKANDWPEDLSHAEFKSEWDIRTQFIMAVPCLLLASFTLLRILSNARKTMTTDDEALLSSQGKRIPYNQIRRIDKTKWDRKGIAELHYQKENTEKLAKTRIDTWIFSGSEAILRDVELNSKAEIVGGTPEQPPPTNAEADADHDSETPTPAPDNTAA